MWYQSYISLASLDTWRFCIWGSKTPGGWAAHRATFIFSIPLAWAWYSKDINPCIPPNNLSVSLSVYRKNQIRELLIYRPKIFTDFQNIDQLLSLWKPINLARGWGRVGWGRVWKMRYRRSLPSQDLKNGKTDTGLKQIIQKRDWAQVSELMLAEREPNLELATPPTLFKYLSLLQSKILSSLPRRETTINRNMPLGGIFVCTLLLFPE